MMVLRYLPRWVARSIPVDAVLVAPLLRAHFYCTESEAYRQQVFYYRWAAWASCKVSTSACFEHSGRNRQAPEDSQEEEAFE